MAKLSNNTSAIDSIAQCLATAAEAARELDPEALQDLSALLRIAACEAERVRKATAPAEPAAKERKKAAKQARAIQVEAAPQKSKSRQKATTANGVTR